MAGLIEKGTEKALLMLRNMPRVALNNIKKAPGNTKRRRRRGKHGGGTSGRGTRGMGHKGTLPSIGHEAHRTPFYLRIPREPYYSGHHVRRQYPPLPLLSLQRMIDLGRLDTKLPIDLAAICSTKLYRFDTSLCHYGVNLTDEGADKFQARINIEVQWASELTIAAIERMGGVITTRYFDPCCLIALLNPVKFFQSGKPIPICKLPPQDAVEYYSDPSKRGYLADPEAILEERFRLSQKYGYQIPEANDDNEKDMLLQRKDPRQIFFGLEPGWVVNLRDKVILKPRINEKLRNYYSDTL